jgi:hypothetical protein
MKVIISKDCPNFNIANSVGQLTERGAKTSKVIVAGNDWFVSNRFLKRVVDKSK